MRPLQHSVRPQVPATASVPTICVVDPRFDDYQPWRELATTGQIRLERFASAAEALRHAHAQAPDLWVVNAELPGISGCELCGMLKNLGSRTAVYLVADEYSPAIELAARQARATLFDCKPLHLAGLETWLTYWHAKQRAGGRPISPAHQPLSLDAVAAN